MRDQAARHGAKFAVISYSSAAQIAAFAGDPIPELAGFPPLKHGRWDFKAPDLRIEQFCQREHIPVLIASREFAKLPAGVRARIQFSSDGHLSPLGHRVLSESLARFIEQERLLEKGP